MYTAYPSRNWLESSGRDRGPLRGPFAYPFTAPAVRPAWICFWKME